MKSGKTAYGSRSVVCAYLGANQNLALGANILNINNLFFNVDYLQEFNLATYRFTPRFAGLYYISASIEASLFAGAPQAFSSYITRNGVTTFVCNDVFGLNNRNYTSKPFGILRLTPNDFIDFRMLGYALPNLVTVIASNTHINIFRIR